MGALIVIAYFEITQVLFGMNSQAAPARPVDLHVFIMFAMSTSEGLLIHPSLIRKGGCGMVGFFFLLLMN